MLSQTEVLAVPVPSSASPVDPPLDSALSPIGIGTSPAAASVPPEASPPSTFSQDAHPALMAVFAVVLDKQLAIADLPLPPPIRDAVLSLAAEHYVRERGDALPPRPDQLIAFLTWANTRVMAALSIPYTPPPPPARDVSSSTLAAVPPSPAPAPAPAPDPCPAGKHLDRHGTPRSPLELVPPPPPAEEDGALSASPPKRLVWLLPGLQIRTSLGALGTTGDDNFETLSAPRLLPDGAYLIAPEGILLPHHTVRFHVEGVALVLDTSLMPLPPGSVQVQYPPAGEPL